jgi:hypothetical protein
MKTYLALALAAAVIGGPLSAQARSGGGHSGAQIPREPSRRESPNAAPESEPGRAGGAIPYVRGDHWYGHAAPNDPRFQLARPLERGRFALSGPGHVYSVQRVDLGARRLWLPGGFSFEIATWDWALTAPWCWDCDQFVVYGDPDHLGWYLLYDVRFGEYVHVQYLGL